ncbi:protein phosphatase 2C domain-containing protein [Streptomyces sp. NPDC057638]|uniref:protein phosphatase 2C domain-containing protein n=1 Tax=Streptomyces sp. NPDC057638 TaxID=3346190 RepID=UPI0036B132E3
MGQLTIGAFARASRLSAKALRRYDELGLLRPASVDPYTGYRYYDETQLDQARLVAWLRRIDMPLVRVQEVRDLYESDPGRAARAVRDYWATVEAETAARRDLAVFLADHLVRLTEPYPYPGRGSDTMVQHTALTMRSAARTDRGLVRETNQDAAYATTRLLAVADGFGGEGGSASAAVIEALKRLDRPDWQRAALENGPGDPGEPAPVGASPSGRVGDLLNALEDAVDHANTAAGEFADSGSTLTAMVWTGSQLALVHVGDTRALLLRDGELLRITRDHTVAQAMIDEGSLTEEEAASHPQRTLLVKAVDGGMTAARPDVRLCEARPGDRYLLCSDGLSRTVAPDAVRRALTDVADPDQAIGVLVELARSAGGPDNIACVVADIVPT